jgi:hypothetical protein
MTVGSIPCRFCLLDTGEVGKPATNHRRQPGKAAGDEGLIIADHSPYVVVIGAHAQPRRRYRAFDGGAYTFGGGKGSRAGSGLSLARIALRVRMRGENG